MCLDRLLHPRDQTEVRTTCPSDQTSLSLAITVVLISLLTLCQTGSENREMHESLAAPGIQESLETPEITGILASPQENPDSPSHHVPTAVETFLDKTGEDPMLPLENLVAFPRKIGLRDRTRYPLVAITGPMSAKVVPPEIECLRQMDACLNREDCLENLLWPPRHLNLLRSQPRILLSTLLAWP